MPTRSLTAVGSPTFTARLFALTQTAAPPFYARAFLATWLTPFAGVN
jgi:hypothetical protein